MAFCKVSLSPTEDGGHLLQPHPFLFLAKTAAAASGTKCPRSVQQPQPQQKPQRNESVEICAAFPRDAPPSLSFCKPFLCQAMNAEIENEKISSIATPQLQSIANYHIRVMRMSVEQQNDCASLSFTFCQLRHHFAQNRYFFRLFDGENKTILPFCQGGRGSVKFWGRRTQTLVLLLLVRSGWWW